MLWRASQIAKRKLYRLRTIASKVRRRVMHDERPRILLLADKRNWAFDHCARAIVSELRQHYDFTIRYVHEKPRINAADWDFLYLFFWGETYHRQFRFDPARVIKEISSHRWEDDPRYGPCNPKEMTQRFLRDAGAVCCTSLRLLEAFRPYHPSVFHTPNGYSPRLFHSVRKRTGNMRIGWAGNLADPVKQFHSVLAPACEGRFDLQIATGATAHRQMNGFYNNIDVFAVSSKHEGEPLPLIEAMAAGCFPVCTNVGIVSELIQNQTNGIIVDRADKQAFREAFEWCEKNLDRVRQAGEANASQMRNERRWDLVAPHFKKAFDSALAEARRPKFRNDDVSPDIPYDDFRRFCEIFTKHGYKQLHGILLRGRTCSHFTFQGEPTQYPNEVDLSKVSNARIRELSESLRFEDRADLIEYLCASPDDLALHGLYHTDYSTMSYEEQKQDIAEGLALLEQIFPDKFIQYFIAPFNRTNEATYRACSELGLHVLANDGVHFEAELQKLRITPGTWYRYHHHRFYPGSKFTYWNLSLEALDAALAQNATRALPNLASV